MQKKIFLTAEENCDEIAFIHDGRSIVPSRHRDIGTAIQQSPWTWTLSSWKVVFVTEAGLPKKKRDADELRDIVPASTPRGVSHLPFWIFPRGIVDGFHKICLTDLCVYGRTRVRGWLIGGTVKSIERRVRKKRDRDECRVEEAR